MIDDIRCVLKDSCLKTECARAEKALLKDKQSNMQVAITGLPDGALVIDIPPNGCHNAMLKPRGTRKSCDYLVLVPNEDGIHACFIEMKKTLDQDQNFTKACEQILCTIPVLDYVVSMVRVHSPDLVKKPKIQRHYTVIAEKATLRFDKQRVKPDKPASRDHRGKHFKIIHSLPEIPVGQLQ